MEIKSYKKIENDRYISQRKEIQHLHNWSLRGRQPKPLNKTKKHLIIQ